MPDATTMSAPPQLDEESLTELTQLVVKGMLRAPVTGSLQHLVDAGLAIVKGPVVLPSPTGTSTVAGLLRLPAGSEVEATVRRLFESFLPVNHALRHLCTAWQVRPDGTPNDHTDAVYDASVRDELDDIDDRIGRVIRRLGQSAPALARYRGALTAAVEKFDAGDRTALTSPLSASYHTVWMWLHQELLLMLGISRAEDERLETALVSASG